MDFSAINYLAVIVSAVASFVIGALWYSPLLFGKTWQKELNFTDEYLKQANMVVIFLVSFVLMFLAVFGLAILIQLLGKDEMCWSLGLWHGVAVGLFFSATAVGINYLYQRRSFILWLIDAFYFIVFMAVSGVILALWQ